MNFVGNNRVTWTMLAALALLLSLAPRATGDDTYSQTNLVSDVSGLAVTTDPNLVNPWGISNSATSPYWISDQGTGVATLYNGLGNITALVVTIPAVGSPSGPTGTVFNNTGGGFLVGSTSANFIFATLSGTIAARATGSTAVTEATAPGAVFTGLALASNGSGNFLYAANFVNGGGIQVFNSSFANVTSTTFAGQFVDSGIPAGYAPYNVQLIGSNLYVTYAEVGVRGAQPGAGLGYVDVFNTSGTFLQRLVSNGPLNAPWGVTMAPSAFGIFSSDLLVGNFGNGEINAFNSAGVFQGTLDSTPGVPLVNQDLWALEFGNGNAGSNPDTLYFTAGIDNQTEGLFGAIAAPEPASLIFLAIGLLGMMGATRKWCRQ